MINRTDLFIYCDWLTDKDIDSGSLRVIVDYISDGVVGMNQFGVDTNGIGSDCLFGDIDSGLGDCGSINGDGDGCGDDGFELGFGFGDGSGFGDGYGGGSGFDLESY